VFGIGELMLNYRNLYFCTFGTDNFVLSKKRIENEIRSSGWFKDIFVYGKEDILEYNRSIEHRGAGYYWWKPTIIKKSLMKINEGDILLYLDAGCSFYPEHKDEFFYYLNELNNTHFLGFKSGFLEKFYTKRDLFKFMDVDTSIYTDTEQIISGIMFMVKSEKTINLVDKWIKLASVTHLINDDESFNDNYPGFLEHRHDQSLLSLLIKKQGGGVFLRDHTNPSLEGKKPITATRIRK
jgi:hypothetical protein